MSMVVRSNMNAMNANRNLSMNNGQVAKSLEKLASGYAINRAGDDASGLAISEKMKAQIKGLEQASSNSQDGISLVQTAEGAMTEIHSMLNRMVELATKSANGTIQDEVDRDAIQTEVNALRDEVDRIADATNFNGIDLLNGNLSTDYTVIKDSTTSTQAESLNVELGSSGLTYGNATTTGYVGTFTASTATQLASSISADTSGLSTNDAGKGTISLDYEVSGQSNTLEAEIVFNSSNDFTVTIGGTTYDCTNFSTTDGASMAAVIKAVETLLVDSVTSNSDWDNTTGALEIKNDTGATVTLNSFSGTGDFEELYNDDPDLVGTVSMNTANLDGTMVTISYQDADGLEKDLTVSFSGDSVNGFTANLSNGSSVNVADYAGGTAGDAGAWMENVINDVLVNELGMDSVGTAGTTANMAGSSTNGNIMTGLEFTSTHSNGAVSFALSATDADYTFTTTPTKFTTPENEINSIKDGSSFSIDGLNYTLDTNAKSTTGDGSTEQPISASSISGLVDEINANLAAVGKNITVRENEDGTGIVWADTELEITTETVVSTGAGLTLQVGDTYDQFNNVTVEIESMKCDSLGIDNISVNDQESAGAAIDTINAAINMVSTNRAELGALQNRLEYTINNLDNTAENMTSANSAIRDTDMASEMMEYTKMNVLVQSAQSMLAQANQAPQQILSLLG